MTANCSFSVHPESDLCVKSSNADNAHLDSSLQQESLQHPARTDLLTDGGMLLKKEGRAAAEASAGSQAAEAFLNSVLMVPGEISTLLSSL